MDDSFGHWLAGYIDGEGTFCCTIRAPRGRYEIGVSMVVGARADDYPILAECQRQTGLGTLNYRPVQKNSTPNARPFWLWAVRNKADCQALVRILDEYPLRAKKARDYAVWREIVLEHAKWRRAGREQVNDIATILELSAKLVEVRQYDSTYERTQ